MAVDLQGLADDVQSEHDVLAAMLADVEDDAWDAPTPAPGWAVRDQIAHLAFFDRVARTAVEDPVAFEAVRREAVRDIGRYVEDACAAAAARSGPDLMQWWGDERRALLGAVLRADPSMRVPWFGPSMSLASKLTARLMETWAHGQDVVDALDMVRPPTARLRHVARIGVLALPNSFQAHRREVPTVPVRVALQAPDGDTWSWGPDDAADSVEGPAEDFCLLVTQRRHLDDTRLVVTGPVATEWMSIAQAFAGPPGEGRSPGQFRRTDASTGGASGADARDPGT